MFCGTMSTLSGAPHAPEVPPMPGSNLEDLIVPIFGMLVPIVLFICVFAFLAFAKRADSRRKEMEAHEKYEFLRKMAEGGSFDVQKYIEFERAEQLLRRKRRIESLNLAGIVLVAVGLAAVPFFYFVTDPELATLGLMPLAVGVALFVGARWMSRSSDQA
jgi:uncharacterized membrane protein